MRAILGLGNPLGACRLLPALALPALAWIASAAAVAAPAGADAALAPAVVASPAASPTAEPTDATADLAAARVGPRPRIGLVLSGGGARGAAHVGVLKVLEELHVPVDFIAGTSMGALVGGLWASGMTAAEIEQALTTVDWAKAFTDRSPRRQMALRRKQDDDGALSSLRVGIRKGKLALPRGVVEGQWLDPVLRRLTVHAATVDDFDRLAVPFRAVATDLVAGEPVVLGSGDLVSALRASMAVPGVFSPIRRAGRLLIDGGIANILPIDVVRDAGVDVVIAVDISPGLLAGEQLASAVAVGDQMINIMIRRETQRQLATLTNRDLTIRPDLGDFSLADFGHAAGAIAIGEAGARKMTDRLAALALPRAAWESWNARRTQRPTSMPVVEEVRVEQDTALDSSLITAHLHVRPGQPLDLPALERDLIDLYGLDLFEKVGYSLSPGSAGGVVLAVEGRRKRWGTSSLRLGLGVADDFNGETAWGLGLRLTVPELSRRGAEWRTDLHLGDTQALASELYWPLDLAGTFVAPRFELRRRDQPIAVASGDLVATYRLGTYAAGLDLGRTFGNWGELRLGLERETGRATYRSGTSGQPTIDYTDARAYLRFAADTLDSVAFPRLGSAGRLEYSQSFTALGADRNERFVRGSVTHARSRGVQSLAGTLELATELGDPSNRVPFLLGGFLRLSGTEPESLAGRHLALARLVYQFRVASGLSAAISTPIYAGASFEAGNVWQQRSAARLGSLRFAGSLFVGMDSVIGPFYLAYGHDEHHEKRWYFYLGRPF